MCSTGVPAATWTAHGTAADAIWASSRLIGNGHMALDTARTWHNEIILCVVNNSTSTEET